MKKENFDDGFFLKRKRSALQLRARVVHLIRSFFIRQDFLEVETPQRLPAPAPEEYIEAFPSGQWYLQTSPELCMKRLIAAGYPQIFQISHCFRAGERGNHHLPEFTLLEWYVTGYDYRQLMTHCENMIWFISEQLGIRTVARQNNKISLVPPWEKTTLEEAFQKYSPVALKETLRRNCFDEILVKHIEPHLGIATPTFVYNYPTEYAALAKLKDGDPSVAERFELYIGGLEIANGFSELTDAVEQRQRFEKAMKRRAENNMAPYEMPEKFLHALKAMPACAGVALGIDRLVMLLSGAEKIDDVVAFTPEQL